jgi:hypothetical protein
MCGAHYHPSYGEQRTCGRVCGVALRRHMHGHAGQKLPKPKPACKICGKPCPNGKVYCDRTCMSQGLTTRPRAICEICGQVCATPQQRTCSRPCAHELARRIPGQRYTCRYCGETGMTAAYGMSREVCPARRCQLARLTANNLRVRNGLTKDEADVQAATMLGTGAIGQGRWQTARAW